MFRWLRWSFVARTDAFLSFDGHRQTLIWSVNADFMCVMMMVSTMTLTMMMMMLMMMMLVIDSDVALEGSA